MSMLNHLFCVLGVCLATSSAAHQLDDATLLQYHDGANETENFGPTLEAGRKLAAEFAKEHGLGFGKVESTGSGSVGDHVKAMGEHAGVEAAGGVVEKQTANKRTRVQMATEVANGVMINAPKNAYKPVLSALAAGTGVPFLDQIVEIGIDAVADGSIKALDMKAWQRKTEAEKQRVREEVMKAGFVAICKVLGGLAGTAITGATFGADLGAGVVVGTVLGDYAGNYMFDKLMKFYRRNSGVIEEEGVMDFMDNELAQGIMNSHRESAYYGYTDAIKEAATRFVVENARQTLRKSKDLYGNKNSVSLMGEVNYEQKLEAWAILAEHTGFDGAFLNALKHGHSSASVPTWGPKPRRVETPPQSGGHTQLPPGFEKHRADLQRAQNLKQFRQGPQRA